MPNVPARQPVTALDAEPDPTGRFDRNQPLDLERLTPNTLKWLGGVLAQSGYFRDATDPAKASAKIIFGRELGLTVGESLTGLDIIEGKPVLSANLLAALIDRSGVVKFEAETETDQECVLTWFKREGGEWTRRGQSKFTIAQAERAGLANKQNWVKYPEDMLWARALTRGAKRYGGAATGGQEIVTTEEIEDGEPVSELEQRRADADPAFAAQGFPPRAEPEPIDWEEPNDQPTAQIPRVEQVIPVRPGVTYDPLAEPELGHPIPEDAATGAAYTPPPPGEDEGDEPFIHPDQSSIFAAPSSSGRGETEPA